MTPNVSLAEAMRDPSLLGAAFAAPSFWPWHAVAKIMSGEPLDSREADLFHACTGRSRVPSQPVRRLSLLAGRRGGKDRFSSAIAVHQAALAADWSTVLSVGEQASVIMLGTDKKQARILRRYCAGLLANPLLATEIVRDTDEMIEFRNGAALEITSNDASLVRGRSAIAIIGTETCFWTTDENKASSDEEVVAAAEPAMAMTPGGGVLLMQSSVYRRQGYMYRRFKECWGNDEAEEIVWLATSQQMNPALPAKVVEDAMARDPARAAAEYNSQWRDDVSSYLPRSLIEAAVDPGVKVRPPEARQRYVGHLDAASGIGADSFAAAVAHAEGDRVVVDAIYERRPPFSPDNAIDDVVALFRQYGIITCTSDRYAAGFVHEALSRRGMVCRYAEKTTSEGYLETIPLFSAGRVRLIDDPRLVSQFAGLERRATIGGRDRIDHSFGQHDDLAAACAGVIALVALPRPAAPVAQVSSFNLGGGDGGYHPLVSSFDDLSGGRRTLRLCDLPAAEWARRGYYHPSDKQKWIERGILPPDKQQETTK